MTWRNKPIHKLYAFAVAAVFALTLAGCGGGGGSASPPPGPTPIESAKLRVQALYDAAKKAAADAQTELDGLDAKAFAAQSAYAAALDAARAAQQAADAAGDANSVAQGASELSVVEAQEKVATTAKERADAAKADTMKHAKAVGDAHTTYMAAVDAGVKAANKAAVDAKADVTTLQKELDALEPEQKAAGAAAYENAMDQLEAAKAAAAAAQQAADAADAASKTTPPDKAQVEANLALAKAERDKASDALAAGRTAIGIVIASYHGDRRTKAIAAAKLALETAKTAKTGAVSKLAELIAYSKTFGTDDEEVVEPTKQQVSDATEEKNKAVQAEANAMAAVQKAEACGSTDYKCAEGAKEEAETALDAAEKAAKAITDAIAALDARVVVVNKRIEDTGELNKAGTAADTAAKDAEAKAKTAEENAKKVADLTSSSSPGAIAAKNAADAARAAANRAKAAADKVKDAVMKGTDNSKDRLDPVKRGEHLATAKSELAKVEEEQAKVVAQLAIVDNELALADSRDQQRRLAAARTDAKTYADMAKGHYDSAMSKATQARAEAVKARDAANKAKAARTDYANADKEAKKAEDAATAAEKARDAAKTASDAAKAEYDKAMAADVTVADAEAARDEAKKQNGIAQANDTGAGGAGPQYMAAKAAADMAAKAANTHVLGLFKIANAYHIVTAADPDANTDDTEAGLIAKNKAAHVDAVSSAIATAAADADNSQGTTSVTDHNTGGGAFDSTDDTGTRWPYNADNDATNGSGDGKITVVVDINNTSYTTTRDDPSTKDTDETNFTSEAGLGSFNHGFEISHDTVEQGDDNTKVDVGDTKTRILVFTDKKQGSARKASVNVSINNRPAVAGRIQIGATDTDLSNATYDHDGDGKNYLSGATFACPTGTDCDYTISAGKVTTMTGYRVTVSGVIPAVNPTEDLSYLAFGIWLQETLTAANTPNTYQFGAFADGGSAVTATLAGVTGDATYTGKAAGVYTNGAKVDYFEGDAKLTADFDDSTITGMINNIVAGGVSMTDVINLNDDGTPADGNIGNGTFNGDARMGTGTTKDNVTTYTYNGTWSGQFYNPADEDDGNNAINKAPGSAAGTFGVTGTDKMGTPDDSKDDVTTSYVGAFGAHKQ